MPDVHLSQLIDDFALAIQAVDASRPVATNARSGEAYQPGIGPHPESQTVDLVAREMERAWPYRYGGLINTSVPYPNNPRLRCDLCIGDPVEWAMEIKMLRILGDNGKANDNILMHILSPYPQHRSALTDITKLKESGFRGRRAILVYAYEAEEYPMRTAIDAFELLARQTHDLGPRHEAAFDGLVHAVHSSGAVFGWEIT